MAINGKEVEMCLCNTKGDYKIWCAKHFYENVVSLGDLTEMSVNGRLTFDHDWLTFGFHRINPKGDIYEKYQKRIMELESSVEFWKSAVKKLLPE